VEKGQDKKGAMRGEALEERERERKLSSEPGVGEEKGCLVT
jgi:hypothetical protein